MDETSFWKIISRTNSQLLENPDLFLQKLSSHLKTLSPDDILDFYLFVKKCRNNAGQGKLWAAGMLMNRGHGTDSGFDYFIYWLTACGETIYKQALNNPDSLADLTIYPENVDFEAELDGLLSTISHTYEDVTHCDFFDAIDNYQSDILLNSNDPELYDLMLYDNENYLKTQLPKLWQKYGSFIQINQSAPPQTSILNEINSQGLGVIRTGDQVSHPKFGNGTIETLENKGNFHFACINFVDHGKKWLVVESSALSKKA